MSRVIISRLIGKPSELYDNLNPDWAPTLHLGYHSTSSTDSTTLGSDSSRYERAMVRDAKRRQLEATTVNVSATMHMHIAMLMPSCL